MTKRDAEKAVVRAAMRWFYEAERATNNWPQRVKSYRALHKACAALAKLKKGRGK